MPDHALIHAQYVALSNVHVAAAFIMAAITVAALAYILERQ